MSHETELVVHRIKGSKVYLIRFTCNQISDQYIATKIRSQISDMIDKSRTAKFVLDLSTVTFMSSSAIGTLTAVSRKAREKGGYVRLAALNTEVMNIFKVTKLDKVLSIFPTAAAAAKE